MDVLARMRRLALSSVLFAMALFASAPAIAQTPAPAPAPQASAEDFSFRKLCPGREEKRHRPGICEAYFTQGMDGRLDAAYYLFARVVDVIDKLDESFPATISSYTTRVYLIAGGAVAMLAAAAVWQAFRTSILALAASIVVILTLSFNALGFSAGYKTDLQLWAELIGIRDELEIRVVMYRADPSKAFAIEPLIERYTKARTMLATGYATSIGFPELSSALKF